MIEIEKDVIPSPEAIDRLAREAEFLGEKTLRDIYFDTPDYRLGKKDYWLRSRNGKFELKFIEPGAISSSAYREVEDDEGIKQALGFPPEVSLVDHLRSSSFLPFCDCTTVRREYRLEGIKVDLDEATYQNSAFTFHAAEIELMVKRPDQIKDAELALEAFAEKYGFRFLKTYGKIIEYVKQERPEQFETLLASGVLTV